MMEEINQIVLDKSEGVDPAKLLRVALSVNRGSQKEFSHLFQVYLVSLGS